MMLMSNKEILSNIEINAAQLDQILQNRGLPGLRVTDLIVTTTDGGQPPIHNVEFPDGGDGSSGGGSTGDPDDVVPPDGYYDAPQSSYAAAQYDAIGGSGMNGYWLATPHPDFWPPGPHNRPATKNAAKARAAELGALCEAHQTAAGFTGRYPEDANEAAAREEGTRNSQGEPDHKDCTELFIIKRVMGVGGG